MFFPRSAEHSPKWFDVLRTQQGHTWQPPFAEENIDFDQESHYQDEDQNSEQAMVSFSEEVVAVGADTSHLFPTR